MRRTFLAAATAGLVAVTVGLVSFAEPPQSSPSAVRDKLPVESAAGQAFEQSEPASGSDSGRRLYQQMLKAAALVTARDGDRLKAGTGWVVDDREMLLVTNYHVVADSEDRVLPDETITVFFPEYRDGELITDPNYYRLASTKFSAEIVDTDRLRDLSMLRLPSLPAGTRALPMAAESPLPGDRVHSLGNPGVSDANWVYTSGTVRQVYPARAWYRGGTMREFRRVETQSPTNPGDSGGPVVSDRGELVAVNQGLSNEGRLMSWFIDVSDVRDFTEKARQWMSASSAEALNDRGVHYFYQERFNKAVDDFTAALKQNPELADAHGNLGWALMELDDLPTAIAEFNEAIRLNARDANYFEGRAAAYASNDQPRKAIEDFTQAIRWQPHNAGLYRDRGDVYAAQDEFARAIADYSRAIKQEEKAEYYNSRGVAYAEQGRIDKAISDYDRAIELDSQNAAYYFNRASAYFEQDDLQAALNDARRMEQVDLEYARQQLDTFYRRYVKVKNLCDEPIHVYLKFHAWTEDDTWKWSPTAPDGGGWAEYLFDPGEEAYLSFHGERVAADRIRIWAEAPDAGIGWLADRDQDCEIVPDEGYPSYFMGSFLKTFQVTSPTRVERSQLPGPLRGPMPGPDAPIGGTR